MDTTKIKQVGISAAYRAGKILMSHFGNLKTVHKKGTIDLVTEADIQSENAIVQTIHTTFPDHSILAEESGSIKKNSKSCWIIDPLDGTTNFAHNLGIFSISIAYSYQDETVFGLVFNPSTAELFTAIKDQYAKLNDTFIRTSQIATVQDSLLVTGFPYNASTMMPRLMTRFQKCVRASQGIRRLGSAALDLCYVACGRFDGFWEENLNPWDTAAGVLIAQEAGAIVTDFNDQPYHIKKKQILATNGHIHSELLILLNSEDTKDESNEYHTNG